MFGKPVEPGSPDNLTWMVIKMVCLKFIISDQGVVMELPDKI